MAKARKTKTRPTDIPTPVRLDSRICFAIAYFATEAEADRYDAWVRERGCTYNGGFFHGMACGRDKGWDYTDKDGVKFYAVTT